MIPKAPFEHKLKLENDAIIALEPNSEKFFVKNADARLEPYSTAIIGNKGSWDYTDYPNFNTGTIGQLRIVPQTGEDCSGCYLKNIDSTNKGKTLLPNVRTINTTNHTITEDFIVQNDSFTNSAVEIPNMEIATWSVVPTFGTLTEQVVENGRIKFTGTTSSDTGYLIVEKTISALDLTPKSFISFNYESNTTGSAYFYISDSAGTRYKMWADKPCVNVTANNNVKMVLPFKAPQSSSGSNPNEVTTTPPTLSAITSIRFGFKGSVNTQVTFYVDNVCTDVGKLCYVEMQVPDNLADSSLEILCDGGSGFQTHRICKLDSTYSTVSVDTTKLIFQDGTLYDYVFSSSGRSVFPKGNAGATVNGLVGQMTYSLIKGAKKHIGFSLNIPPSDNDRTNFNKIKLRFIVSYNVQNKGLTTYEFSNDNAHFTGLQNIEKPLMGWTTTNGIEFYIFDRPLKVLSIKEDESKVYEVVVGAKENTRIYHGYISYKNKTTDSNSDGVPDVIDAIERMCKRVEEVKDYWLQVAFNPSITTNDFSIQLADCEQSYSVVAGSVVKNGSTILQPIRTENGIDYYNVAGISSIKVKENDNRTMECRVWDTVTTTNNNWNTYKRIYDINHVFTGRKIFENGSIQLTEDETGKLGCVYVKYNGNWVYFTSTSYATNLIYPLNEPGVTTIKSMSNDSITVTRTIISGIFIGKIFDITIKKGFNYLNIVYTNGTSAISYYPKGRFFFNGNIFYDSETYKDNALISFNNGSQYEVYFSPTSNWIVASSRSSNTNCSIKPKYPDVAGWMYVGSYSSNTRPCNIFIVPFNCTKIFTDSANMVGGDVV